jgi:urea-proton symporter
MLAGNVAALLSPCIFIPILTYAFGPDNYDWESMRAIRRADDDKLAGDPEVVLEASNPAENDAEQQSRYVRAGKIARWTTVGMTLILLVLWPMPLYGSGYIFSKSFFTGWVSVGILWLFGSAFCVALYPLWEGRHSMAHTFKSIFLDITGRRKPAIQGRHGRVIEGEGSDEGTPTEQEKVDIKSR